MQSFYLLKEIAILVKKTSEELLEIAKTFKKDAELRILNQEEKLVWDFYLELIKEIEKTNSTEVEKAQTLKDALLEEKLAYFKELNKRKCTLLGFDPETGPLGCASRWFCLPTHAYSPRI